MNTSPLTPLEGRWLNDTAAMRRSTLNTDAPDPAFQAFRVLKDELLTIDPTDSAALAAFATANGLSYSEASSFDLKIYGHDVPAWVGPNPNARPLLHHEMRGTLGGFDVTFMSAYTESSVQGTVVQNNLPTNQGFTIGISTEGQGRMQPVRLQKRGVIRVALPKVFPQLVLDSNKNDRGIESSFPTSFKEDQKLHLEGNFDTYFDFFSPVGLQVNSLTVLAPNFMQLIVDSAATFDVEFYGGELFLVTKDPLFTPSVMDIAFKALGEQLTYLSRLLGSWNYTPLSPPFDRLYTSFINGSTIKIGKLRISPAVFAVVVIVLFIIVIVAVNLLKKKTVTPQ